MAPRIWPKKATTYIHAPFQSKLKTRTSQFSNWAHKCHFDIQRKFKSEIDKFEKETEKAEKILKICNIFSTNCFSYGVAIKTSRFNHSCNPNATAMAR